MVNGGLSRLVTVADPEICLRGKENLQPRMAAVFFTSFKRDKGAIDLRAPWILY